MIKRINQDLKTLLGDELYSQIEAKLKDKDVVIETTEGYIPKDRFDSVNNDLKDYKTKYESQNTELEKLKQTAAGNEQLTAQIQKLQDENNKTKTEYETRIAAQEKGYLTADYLRSIGVKNPQVFMKLLDSEKIIIKEGKLAGIEEQIKPFKEDEAFSSMFGIKQEPKLDRFGNPIVDNNGGGNGGANIPNPESPEYLSWRRSHNVDGSEIKH